MTDRKESKIPYVSLHNHSGYSLFDGFGNPTDHLDFAYSNGLDAHVFTEHGHMNSLSEAFIHNKKMNKEGRNFKQIYGIESYFIDSLEDWRQLKEDKNKEKEKETKSDEDESSYENEEETKSDKKRDPLKIRSHLVILAKNEVGLKNLFKLTSQSHIGDNYYYYPRIDFENLKNNSEGLIVNSACLHPETNVITNYGIISLFELDILFKQNQDILILSFNENEKKLSFEKVLFSDITRKDAKLMKIKLKNGKIIKLTPDHKVFTENGWIEAQNLSLKDKILSL